MYLDNNMGNKTIEVEQQVVRNPTDCVCSRLRGASSGAIAESSIGVSAAAAAAAR